LWGEEHVPQGEEREEDDGGDDNNMSDQWKRLVRNRLLQMETLGLTAIHLGPVVGAPASLSMNDSMWHVAERNDVVMFGSAWIEPVDSKRVSVCRVLSLNKVKACKEPE
jgi:hypothetical protein